MNGLGLGIGAPLGGGSAPPFSLLSSVDQAAVSGVSPPFDPGGLAQAGTGFTVATGRFRWVEATDASIRDGYAENGVGWTKRLVDLYPNFDTDLDIIQLALKVITPPPPSATIKWGMAFGILDEPTSGFPATWNGPMWGYKANTAANYNQGSMGQVSDNMSNVMSAVVPQILLATFNQAAGTSGAGAVNNELASTMRVRRTDGVWEQSVNLTGTPMADAPSGWVIHVRDVCDTASSTGGCDMVAELYHRRIRTAGLRGLGL